MIGEDPRNTLLTPDWCRLRLLLVLVNVCRIKLRIPHEVAGGIMALRAALEALVVEVTKEPEYIRQMDRTNERLLNLIRQISKPSAAGLNMMANNQR